MSPNLTQLLKQQSAPEDDSWQPVFFRLAEESDAAALEKLLSDNPNVVVRDQIMLQLKDLVKLENPKKTLTEEEYQDLIQAKLNGLPSAHYGVWVYYPWKREIVHLLDEEEFIRVRTIRNAYKITFEEQAILRTKKIGVIGLSVGQSAAIAVAMERIAGEIRLADFDHIELSNLNRLRANVQNIKTKKTLVVAREIAEIDPFIKVQIYSEGINQQNVEQFLDGHTKLDCLIEECDSIAIKILARKVARRKQIPVVMDTSDRGLLDIERFDQEPGYPILHGLVDENASFEFLQSLITSEQKLPFIVPFSGLETLSKRMKASAMELGISITTWPQLSSDVTYGGVLCALACREILLGKSIISQRTWNDIKIKTINNESTNFGSEIINDTELDSSFLNSIQFNDLCSSSIPISDQEFVTLIEAARMAPSAGNLQKWKFIRSQNNIFLVLNRDNSTKLAGDNRNVASYLSFGMVIENLSIAAKELHLKPIVKIYNETFDPVIARITFEKVVSDLSVPNTLYKQIPIRYSDRNSGIRIDLTSEELKSLGDFTHLENCEIAIFPGSQSIELIGNLITNSDRLRIMNQQAHHELFNLELRWETNQTTTSLTGIAIDELRLSYKDEIGLKIAKDYLPISFLKDLDKGNGLLNISKKQIDSASAFGMVYQKSLDKNGFINAGSLIEKFWLKCTELNIGFQPMSFSTMLFQLATDSESSHLNEFEIATLLKWRKEINSNFSISSDKQISFIFRLHKNTQKPEYRRRLPISQIAIQK
jgi:molybdopterin/thiamine biosynthesis adenylyltransferase